MKPPRITERMLDAGVYQYQFGTAFSPSETVARICHAMRMQGPVPDGDKFVEEQREERRARARQRRRERWRETWWKRC